MEKEITEKEIDSLGNTTTSGAFLKEIQNKMFDYMIESINEDIIKVKSQLTEINKSERKNKKELMYKFNELITVLEKLLKKMEEQGNMQKEVFELSNQKKKLNDEIELLLIS